jgi:hypothetical protein
MSRFVGAVLLVFLAACGSSHGDYEYAAEDDATEEAADEARQAVYEEHGADGDGTGADASNVDAYSVENTGDYVCTEDCSGHEAGFAWAQENDFTDSADCGGNSQSFIEGCEAFANARQEQADQEAQQAAEEAAEDASYEAEAESDAEYESEH